MIPELPAFPTVDTTTFADAPRFEMLFQIPDLASRPGDAKAYRSAVWSSGIFTPSQRVGRRHRFIDFAYR